jgi:thiol-disulfide isomerase/thioredoxin
MKRIVVGVVAVVAVAAAVGVAVTWKSPAPDAAPRVSIATTAALPVVERRPYDENADANAAVDAAFARAKANGKRVLIDLGGNWCGDCIVLANIMQLPEMKPYIAAHFEVVTVDVGRFNKNLQIPARFGITKRLEGVPAVIIAEPDGTFVNPGKITALADARHMTPQGIADWLAQWAK